jgi:hypothetical protein
MKIVVWILLIISLLGIDRNFNKSYIQPNDDYEIWQLDYYPDSIIYNRSINDNSKWCSSYAYNIKFKEDSCKFYGFHEGWSSRLIKKSENEFWTDTVMQYFELIFKSDKRLLMREIFIRSNRIDTGEFYPFHKVDQLLTRDSLKKLVVNKLFMGKYQLLYNDTFSCNEMIEFDDEFNVKGIEGITKYNIVTEMICDFPVDNAFGFGDFNYSNMSFTFNFNGDTLFIKDYTILSDGCDFSGIIPNNTRIKLLKLNNNTQPKNKSH